MTNVWSPTSSNPSAIAALGGDVTGTVGANTVVKLRGRAIAATAPTDGQVYQYVAANSDWEPKTVGGGSGVQVVTVPVSSAQILDLFNTPVVLIPGVAGSVTVVNSAAFAYLAGGTPYTDNGGNITVSPNNQVFNWASNPGLGFWDQAASQVGTQPFGSQITEASAVLSGIDVVLREDTANPTDGDGTLLVTLSYFLAPTV